MDLWLKTMPLCPDAGGAFDPLNEITRFLVEFQARITR
jgi:hypothetical protein